MKIRETGRNENKNGACLTERERSGGGRHKFQRCVSQINAEILLRSSAADSDKRLSARRHAAEAVEPLCG
ncbi:MAG: hypothetical protein IJ468_01015 [Lachnospiraceae bacterium]|nr:hypothetical protein [Lachnospiraceae bacterium]